MKFSKKIVVLIVLMNIIFTMAALVAFIKVGSEPGALIAAWFSFTTVELWQLASIRKHKLKRKKGDVET